jgi:hypothetical protein
MVRDPRPIARTTPRAADIGKGVVKLTSILSEEISWVKADAAASGYRLLF